jgi:hypothetical protein
MTGRAAFGAKRTRRLASARLVAAAPPVPEHAANLATNVPYTRDRRFPPLMATSVIEHSRQFPVSENKFPVRPKKFPVR